MPKPIGNDGWPLDYDPDKERRQFARALRRDMGELERRWRAGDTTAIPQAVRRLLRQQGSREDWWLLEAVEQLVARRMPEDEKRLRREFDVHQRRWEAVVELHQRRFELAEKDDERGMTLDDCFVAVSELLSEINSEAAGGAETMRRSYRLIEAAGGAHATAETFKRARRFFK